LLVGRSVAVSVLDVFEYFDRFEVVVELCEFGAFAKLKLVCDAEICGRGVRLYPAGGFF
jgi:hypothetical protein